MPDYRDNFVITSENNKEYLFNFNLRLFNDAFDNDAGDGDRDHTPAHLTMGRLSHRSLLDVPNWFPQMARHNNGLQGNFW